MSRQVPDVLTRSRHLVEPALQRAVGRLSGSILAISEYHFGWREADGTPANVGVGKGVRSALTLLGAAACSGDQADALPGAVAIELVHNFSLIHDDIIDGDQQRRHRPAVWSLYGRDWAIIVADALVALAFAELGNHRFGDQASALLASATLRMIHGQGDDMTERSLADVSVGVVERTARGKTGAILGCAAALGATLTGAPRAQVEALAAYGESLGVAFQAVDDVLGIWGDSSVTGKPVGSDLRERRRTLPVALAVESAHPRAGLVLDLLDKAHLSDHDVDRATTLLDEMGLRASSEDMANDFVKRALDSLAGAGLDPAAVEELTELAHFVCWRDV